MAIGIGLRHPGDPKTPLIHAAISFLSLFFDALRSSCPSPKLIADALCAPRQILVAVGGLTEVLVHLNSTENEGRSWSGVRLLLIHQNFPGQFRQLAPHLEKRGHELVAIARTNVRLLSRAGAVRRTSWPTSVPGHADLAEG